MKQFMFYISFFIATLCCLSPVSAQLDGGIYAVSKIPKSLINERTYAVLRNSHETFRILTVGKSTHKVWKVVTLLDKRAESLRVPVIYYDAEFDKLSDVKATVYDANGKEVEKSRYKHRHEAAGDDGYTLKTSSRIKYIDLEYFQYPMTIEWSYEVRNENMMFYENWQPQFDDEMSVEKSVFRIESSIGDVVRHKSVLTDEPNITKKGNDVNYEWSVANIKVKGDESYHYGYVTTPTVYTAPKKFEVAGYEGNMNTWQNFGLFLNKLHEGRDELPAELVKELKELTKDCSDKKCKVEKIYDYLQKNTRYVSIQLGIGGWQPFKANYVAKNKYGDCKALSNFTKAMLKAVDVEAYCCIISAGNTWNPMFPDFPISRFNHEIACVPLEKDTIWLECTSQDNAMGYLGRFTDNRDALVLTPRGGEVWHTKSYTPEDNQQKRVGTIKINAEQGTARCEFETVYTGQQTEHRDRVATQDTEEKKKWLLKSINASNVTIDEIGLTLEKTMIPKVTLKANVRLGVYAKKSGKRLFIPLNVLDPFHFTMIDTTQSRTLPVQFQRIAMEDKDEWQIEIPEGFSVEDKTKTVKIESRFGVFESSVEINGNIATYRRRILLNNKKHPEDSVSELIKFGQSIEKADRARMVLVEK